MQLNRFIIAAGVICLLIYAMSLPQDEIARTKPPYTKGPWRVVCELHGSRTDTRGMSNTDRFTIGLIASGVVSRGIATTGDTMQIVLSRIQQQSIMILVRTTDHHFHLYSEYMRKPGGVTLYRISDDGIPYVLET